jgi:hypothetical protein
VARRRERVFLDANVMIPTLTNNVVLSIAHRRIFDPRWSRDVLMEVRRHPPTDPHGNEVPPEYFDHRFAEMAKAFRRGQVRGYEELVPDMPAHPRDKHVLAGALQGNCDVLLTENTKDFYLRPGDSVTVHGEARTIRVEPVSAYLTKCLRDRPKDVEAGLDTMLARNEREPRDMPRLIESMATKPELYKFAHTLNKVVVEQKRASPEALARAEDKRLGKAAALDGLTSAHDAVQATPRTVATRPGRTTARAASRDNEHTM